MAGWEEVANGIKINNTYFPLLILSAAGLAFSYRKLNKLIGNSIVVNVLQAIFQAMFENKYAKETDNL